MPIASILGAGIIGGGSLLSGILNSSAINSAASTEAGAANNAANIAAQEYLTNQSNLAPYFQTGTNVLGNLAQFATSLVSPATVFGNAPTPLAANNGQAAPTYNPQPTTANVSPYLVPMNYQLQQESNALANAYTAGSGAISGNVLNALQTNAQGLASTDYNTALTNYLNQYQNTYNAANNNYWNNYNALSNQWGQNTSLLTTHQQQLYQMLGGIAGLGENAAAMAGNQGIQSVGQYTNALAGGANAIAAGMVGSTQALTGGLTSSLGQLGAPSTTANSSALSAALSYILGTGGGDYGGGYDTGSSYYGGGGTY